MKVNTYQRMITAVVGVALRSDGKFLCTQRVSHDVRTNGKWQFPGGEMEFGEQPEQTLAREFEEELQCSAHILYPYPIVKVATWEYEEKEQKKVSTHLTVIAYVVSIEAGTPNCSNDPETQAFDWFSLEEIAELECLPMVKEIAFLAKQISVEQKLLTNL